MDEMDTTTRTNFKEEMMQAKEVAMVMSQEMPKSSAITTEAIFKEHAHSVAGKALLIEHDGGRTLRFEDFETVNGPNLHIYLSTDLDANDFVDLGKIKATRGSVNYEIANSVDVDRYNKVLVWCVPFGVLFSYAELN